MHLITRCATTCSVHWIADFFTEDFPIPETEGIVRSATLLVAQFSLMARKVGVVVPEFPRHVAQIYGADTSFDRDMP